MATLFNLPASVPTVTLHGKYLGPDGRPLRGWVEILAPTPLTFPTAQAFVTGPVVIPLDAEGGFTVTLPATDVEGSNPADWAYWITEKLQGMRDRKPYAIKLPQALKDPWLDQLAPTDPGTPNYVGVEGNRIYQGSAVPPAGLGRHGDMYVRTEVTAAFLNVSDTRVTVYANVDGTWVMQSGEVRGSKIYVNNASTPSTATKPGDLLIRSDNGDFYQRDASGWGTVRGNLKGPKGDKGDIGVTGAQGPQGIQGAKGDKGDVGATGPAGVQGPKGDTGSQGPQGEPGKDGTGAGTVTAVNAVQPDGTGNVTLAAGDVGALSTTGGTITPATGHGLTVYGSTDPATYFRITAEGHPYSNSTRATFYNVGIGDTATPFGGGKFVLGFKNASVAPTTNPTNGAVLYSEGGKLKLLNTTGDAVELGGVPADVLRATDKNVANGVAGLNEFGNVPTANLPDLGSTYVKVSTRGVANGVATLDGTGKVPAAQLPATGDATPNIWTPGDLGFVAWNADPAVMDGKTPNSPSGAPGDIPASGRIYYSSFIIRKATTVSKLCVHTYGYSGSAGGITGASFAGIYSASGGLLAKSAPLSSTSVFKDEHSVGGATTYIPITAQSLAPGVYVMALLISISNSANAPIIASIGQGNDASGKVGTISASKPPRFFMSADKTNTDLPASVSWTGTAVTGICTRYWMALA
jgi:hypothetical protein